MIFDDTDKAFIAETYPSPDWTVDAIAKTLEKQPHQIRGYATYAGLKRPGKRGGFIRHNWRLIWDTARNSRSVRAAAKELGIESGAVQYAMARMRLMTPEQRQQFWEEWGHK